MDRTLLFDNMALLSSYIVQTYALKQAGQPVNEALLQDAEQILRRLSMVASIKAISSPKLYN